MKYEIKITDNEGNERSYNVSPSPSEQATSLNDFILKALNVSEEKRNIPFIIQCPNGLEVFPSIKMKFENYGSPISGDKLEAMVVTWHD